MSGSTLTLTLSDPAQAGQTVTVSYKQVDGHLPLQGTGGKAAPLFHDPAVTNNTPGVAGPEPVRASVARGRSCAFRQRDVKPASDERVARPAPGLEPVETKAADSERSLARAR